MTPSNSFLTDELSEIIDERKPRPLSATVHQQIVSQGQQFISSKQCEPSTIEKHKELLRKKSFADISTAKEDIISPEQSRLQKLEADTLDAEITAEAIEGSTLK